MVPRQQLCTQTINVEWSSLKIKLLLEFLQYVKKQAERGVGRGRDWNNTKTCPSQFTMINSTGILKHLRSSCITWKF